MAIFALRGSARRIDVSRGRAHGSIDEVGNSGSPRRERRYRSTAVPRADEFPQGAFGRPAPAAGDRPHRPIDGDPRARLAVNFRHACACKRRRSAAARASIGRSRRVAHSTPSRFVSINPRSTSRSRLSQKRTIGGQGDRTTPANNSKPLRVIGSYGLMRTATRWRVPDRVSMRPAQRCRERSVAATRMQTARSSIDP